MLVKRQSHASFPLFSYLYRQENPATSERLKIIKCFEGIVSCIIKPEPGRALSFTRSWKEGKDRLKDRTEQVRSSLPQAHVLRDYRCAGLESAVLPPQTLLATPTLSLGFAAGALGFLVSLVKANPVHWSQRQWRLPFFFFFPFILSFQTNQHPLFSSAVHPFLSLKKKKTLTLYLLQLIQRPEGYWLSWSFVL